MAISYQRAQKVQQGTNGQRRPKKGTWLHQIALPLATQFNIKRPGEYIHEASWAQVTLETPWRGPRWYLKHRFYIYTWHSWLPDRTVSNSVTVKASDQTYTDILPSMCTFSITSNFLPARPIYHFTHPLTTCNTNMFQNSNNSYHKLIKNKYITVKQV
jgi:hypothetical protein